ncbi:MAG: putative DNA binding domain-containing protein [Oscillospiraceae bacterium]|nr:putative DNA binding domain-containing protein [Oscillospiraceae bacterium]
MVIQSNDLTDLLNAPEGSHYEFKEWKHHGDFTKAAQYCCALANCGGGFLVLGVTDKRPRKVVGSIAFEQPERTCKELMDKLHIKVEFQILENNDMRVLVFAAASRPAGLPVHFDGIAWWRDGDSLVTIPPEVLRDIYEETGHDFSGDICHGATITDLDERAISVFRDVWAEKNGNNRIKNLSAKQLLMDCGAITSDGATYAALILFGTRAALKKYLSQAEVIFEYRSSDASGPAQQREEFTQGFFSFFDRILELVNLRNDMQHYQAGLFVFDVPTFNERVVREALLNAISHRNYQMSGSVFVRQYRDRLVIENPGGFPSGITVDNILNRQSPRNRLIASILALCGLVERSGQGMNLIYELSVKEAKPLPDFSGTDAYWVFLTLNGLVIYERLLSMLKQIGDERMKIFSTADFLVIDALFHERKLTDELRRNIKRLIDMGVVEHSGRGKYVLARSLYEATDKTGVHTRIIGLDRETNKELLLKNIRRNGDKGTPLKELQQVLPSHSRNQLKVLIRELQQSDLIYVKGKTSAARWFVR